ncbi:MAG: Soluble lytic murein transglycosylase [Luteibacter sp.]|uniref:transglycosylase SLT domain-containing protein n=1 Tax=Luteibacter sp. TaxID=1886636 RepID=UPI001381C068|nr:transglycosylase SLT domain-containing protein [Luteibacter sp.]KAF1009570.1 MAG: Soluble lytic murein transglycosylase [Luteibacter sp.]
MTEDVSPGECAGRAGVRFRVSRPALRRVAAVCVLFLALLLAGPASAGALYRCIGATGETVFSGSAAGYRECKKIGNTGPSRPAKPAKPVLAAASVSLPPAAPAPVASLAGVTASVVSYPGDGSEKAPAVPPAKRGWSYQESASADLTAGPAPEPEKGSRVLRGAVYRITRADGGVEYTNIPPGGAPKGQSIKMLFTYIATCVACDIHSKIDWNSVGLNLTAYGDVVRAASIEYGVDEALLRAVIHAESAFNPRALSVAGAQGLMQLIPGTARDMGVLDAFDANQNIRGGARYLALLLRNFNGNERLAAAAYNAGPKAVERYNGVPPYDETQVYVERVGILRRRYGESLRHLVPTRSP